MKTNIRFKKKSLNEIRSIDLQMNGCTRHEAIPQLRPTIIFPRKEKRALNPTAVAISPTAAGEISRMALAGRRDGPLMLRGGGGGKPLSRGSRIAVAVAIGIALGCVCAFLYPAGLFRPSASALRWSRHVLLSHSLFLVFYYLPCIWLEMEILVVTVLVF